MSGLVRARPEHRDADADAHGDRGARDLLEGGAPGEASNSMVLSPSQLGVKTSFSSIFGSAKKESAPFTGEPARESLTQPPSGYQTPSPNYAYGTGQVDWSKVGTDPITGLKK